MNIDENFEPTSDLNKDLVIKLEYRLFDKIYGHLYLFIIFVALFGNTSSFFIFRSNKQMQKLSSMIILSYVVIFDTFSLFTWNLNGFLKPNFQIAIEHLNIVKCRIFLFMQYMSSQTSSLLLAILTIDRFVSIFKRPGSFISRLPFTTRRTAHLWSILILIFTTSLNFHMFITPGVYKPFNSTKVDGKIQFIKVYKTPGFDCYDFNSKLTSANYNILNLCIYSVLPSLIMITFNLAIFWKTFKNKKLHTKNPIAYKTFTKKKKITYNLLAITTSFILMTLPCTIYFAFIYKLLIHPYERYFGYLFTSLEFSNHASVFFISYLTNKKFRKIAMKYLYKISFLKSFPNNKIRQSSEI